MKIDTGLYPPEVVAKDILNSFSAKEIDEIIDALQEGKESSIDNDTQGFFSWGEVGEKWIENGEKNQNQRVNGEKN